MDERINITNEKLKKINLLFDTETKIVDYVKRYHTDKLVNNIIESCIGYYIKRGYDRSEIKVDITINIIICKNIEEFIYDIVMRVYNQHTEELIKYRSVREKWVDKTYTKQQNELGIEIIEDLKYYYFNIMS